MGDLEKRFGRLLAAHRRARGLTQDQLATKSGLSVDMISKVEAGRSGVRFPSIERLADALEVDAAAFFTSSAPGRSRKLENITAQLAALSEDDLGWVESVLRAALKPRRSRGQSD